MSREMTKTSVAMETNRIPFGEMNNDFEGLCLKVSNLEGENDLKPTKRSENNYNFWFATTNFR